MGNGNSFFLEFEKPLIDLENQIEEIKTFGQKKEIDMTDEISRLQLKVDALREKIFSGLTPLQKVQIARHPKRPTFYEYVERIFEEFTELHGDRLFKDDPAIIGGLAFLEEIPVTVIGQQKGRDTKENLYRNFGMPHPEGYRKGLRLMKQAERFNRPIITLVDVAGAYPGIEAEERGQGEAVAKSILEMSGLKVPIIVVITGEGGSGGALAVAVGDRLLMLEHAYYSVISPEGCASILWKNALEAPRAADVLHLTAQHLLGMRIIDEIIPEPLGGAHNNLQETAESIKAALIRNLAPLLSQKKESLIADRYQKYRDMGAYR